MPKHVSANSNRTRVVHRDKREDVDKILVELDPNPKKSRSHASIEVHETGLGIRGDIVMTTTRTPAVKEDPAQLTFAAVLGK